MTSPIPDPDVLDPGTRVLAGGKLLMVPEAVAAVYQPGDRLLAVGGEILHLPKSQCDLAEAAVSQALDAFARLGSVTDEAIGSFYRLFADRLAADDLWARIVAANVRDVARAKDRGRSTTRLAVSEKMRQAMIEGLLQWEHIPSRRGVVVDTIQHDGWTVEQVVDGLGVVGFVFEGRPNVFADATGMLRGGNTAVMRIGGDALGTAQAIADAALRPALREAGLPEGAVTLLASAARSSGWALFSDSRLALAVARGSGSAVSQLGAIARQAGIPVSLHGTGGAWLIADETADPDRFRSVLFHSLDRKVCNTANVIVVLRESADRLVPEVLAALRLRGAQLGNGFKLHVTETANSFLPPEVLSARAPVLRAEGATVEPVVEAIAREELGVEWEWEGTPEVSLDVVEQLSEATALCNQYSPRFCASLISQSPERHEWFFHAVDAPFVGDGFTRWVDGQYALKRPELGLSNWQFGRLFGRGGILSGDSVFTVRLRVRQSDPDLHR